MAQNLFDFARAAEAAQTMRANDQQAQMNNFQIGQQAALADDRQKLQVAQSAYDSMMGGGQPDESAYLQTMNQRGLGKQAQQIVANDPFNQKLKVLGMALYAAPEDNFKDQAKNVYSWIQSQRPDIAKKLGSPETWNQDTIPAVLGMDDKTAGELAKTRMIVSGKEAVAAQKTTDQEPVLSTPQLYTNPKSGRQEMWFFTKTGQPASFVRTATQQDIKGQESVGDRELIKTTIKELPKLKEEAIQQKQAIGNIDDALDLLNTGRVTGKTGQLKAWLAPYAEAMGIKTQDMDDAAKFAAITKLIRGPLRSQIIGPGQVSNYEQQLLNEMGGGGGTAVAAAKKLLTYYRESAQAKVENYNQTLEGAVGLDPTIGRVHKKIDVMGKNATAASAAPAQQQIITATNPQTGQKIKSVDGGKTWQTM